MNWQEFKKSLAHAFKVTDGREDVTEKDIALLDRLANFVVNRRMTSPAILFLQTVVPLNFVGSSIMTFFRPTLGWLFNREEYERLERLLEKRCCLELLTERIEHIESNRNKDNEPAGPNDQVEQNGTTTNVGSN
ncbi:hypothetical protein ACFL54_02580 [Planctomycetota bacterium]